VPPELTSYPTKQFVTNVAPQKGLRKKKKKKKKSLLPVAQPQLLTRRSKNLLLARQNCCP
jgi:hypothetical protein